MKIKNTLIKTFLLTVVLSMTSATAFGAASISNIRIIRADYCGDGTAFTKPYNRIVIIVKNDDNDEVANVAASMEPVGKSPKPGKTTIEAKWSKETSSKDAKRFVYTPLEFAGDIEGATYKVTLVMYNAKGGQIGNKVVQNVAVDSKGENICGDDFEINDVIFYAKRTRGMGGTITQMASAIQYAADQGMKVQDTVKLQNVFQIAKTSSKAVEVWVYYAMLNAKGNREFLYNQAKLNEKSGLWEVVHQFNASSSAEINITDGLISVKNPCGEIVWHTIKLDRITGFGEEGVRLSSVQGFSKDLAKEISGKGSACNTTFKLNEITIQTTNTSGIYTLNFNFQFDSSSNQADTVVLVVQLENCSGTRQNIAITLKYDPKSGTYLGSQAVSQSKDCPWVLTKGEIGAYNTCGYLTFWTFKYDQSKSNGKGTRAATTASNASPGLL